MRFAGSSDSDADLALFIESAHAVCQQRKILGPEVEALERKMAKWLQTKYAIGCNSGFGAHLLSLLALDLKPGARVAVPVFAPSDFIGTVLLRQHLTPVLIDINTHDFQMDVSELSRHIGDKIDAIIVYHLFGGTVDMHEVMDIADNIPVIEVLTHSLGAHIDDRYAGTFGTVATADLFTTMRAWGDAGMLWTNNESLAEKICKIRSENGTTEVHTGIVSGNFHQHTIQAAFLLRKFEGWERKAKKRSEQITAFVLAMRDRRICEIAIPEFYNHYGTELVILADHRNELMEYLQERNIETSTWWPLPIHLQPGFQRLQHKRGDFPQAEWVTARLLQLPVPENENEIDCLVESIANFYKSSFYPQRVF